MSELTIADKLRIKASFERAASHYDNAAVLQREVSQRMASRLDYIKIKPDVIIDAGSGTGEGATQLKQRYPESSVIELDFAFSMLAHSRHKQVSSLGILSRLFKRNILRHICADIEILPLADASSNMIWSNLAIQWTPIPDKIFAEFYRVLTQDGMLMFSTFGPDTLMELRESFRSLGQGTHVNPFIDMHDLGDALLRHGFSEPVMDMEKITLTYGNVRSILQDLKSIGAHTMINRQRHGLLGKAAWSRLQENYEAYRTKDGTLPTTYEIIYGHAWKGTKPPSRSPLGNHQVIQFNPPIRP